MHTFNSALGNYLFYYFIRCGNLTKGIFLKSVQQLNMKELS